MTSIADAFSAVAVAGRTPTWAEYQSAAPCDQRAIIARWFEIAQRSASGREIMEACRACGLLARAGQKTPLEIEKQNGVVRDTLIFDDGKANYSQDRAVANSGAPSWLPDNHTEWEGI